VRARLWQLYDDINDSFWLRPSLIVLVALALAEVLINAERANVVPTAIAGWVYSGGETGARTLLGAVAGSTIGVAGTVFSITIATLTLASNQMGPRLLRNFTRDVGNQVTLGVYLGTFVYALIVLRSVRGADQGAFVPHMAISGAIALALLCVAMLIYFVDHVAGRINFDTVIDLVSRDLDSGLKDATTRDPQPEPLDEEYWAGGLPIVGERSGYIQQLDDAAIADWAEANGVAVRLHARTGDFLFPHVQIATVVPPSADAQAALRSAIVTGAYPTPSMDVEFAVDQLVDIAVRALSSGINDPKTAVRVLDRLGEALCTLSPLPLRNGVTERKGRVVFQRDTTTYDGLVDAMFNTIRQSASTSTSVLVHLLEILNRVAMCERSPDRIATLARHGKMVFDDGMRTIVNANDRSVLGDRAKTLEQTMARALHPRASTLS
jgi:uncharacterized membrane protein